MQTRSPNTFTSVHTEGSLLPADLLQRVLSGDKDLGGLAPADYHLPGNEKLNEAVNRSWNRLQGAWAAFQTSRSRLKEGDPGTTLTRERWLLPLFQELGYGRLATTKAIEIDGKAYPISHGWANVPIHLVGCGIDLDRRAAGVAGASKSSPHSLVQELLNQADDRQWGIASNGLRLRILRDNASLTRQAYLEFDLEAMFSGDVYADFVLLWLLSHQSRFEPPSSPPAGGGRQEGGDPWLEKWAKAAQESGTRALDQLRNGVEEAITALGSGFLSHPNNQELRKRLRSGELDAQDYYRQLLRLVYRLIFLFAAEDRDLLLDPGADTTARDRYLRYYSTARLRRLAERQRGGRHSDLWQGLLVVTDILSGKELNREDSKSAKGLLVNNKEDLASFASLRLALGLPVLNGFLFSEKSLPDLENSQVDNQALLTATRSLAFTVEGSSLRAVDYKNLGPEELGSVYESLLELHPRINSEAGTFELSSASGHERKTTGSYYTPTSLIQVLLDSALDPVIEQAIQNAGPAVENQRSAILNLKICDPACGSGHFLIAAAHRIARRLAQMQAGGDEPPPSALRQALRAVIARCIYGVDVNPMAVELCKVNLWLESIEPGKPLSFLDAHIQCGDSLVGVGPGLDISEIPDEAFNSAFGDDKATAAALRKRNKRERGGQLGFRWKMTELTGAEDLRRWRAERAGHVDAMPEDDPAQVQAKAQAFAEFQGTQEYIQNRLEYDLWIAAFFWRIPKGDAEHMLAPTQQELVMLRSGGNPDAVLVEQIRQLAERLNFFHWELAFPQVFAGEDTGFDCVLGNPPWERIKLQEEEFFVSRDQEIAAAPNKAARQKLIDTLVHSNPPLARAFEEAKHAADSASKFVRQSERFSLTSGGDVNTYTLFAELNRSLINENGRVGVIVPTGISTDETTKEFFSDIVKKQSIVSLFDFENSAPIFAGVHRSFKFCLLTLSNTHISNPEFVFFARRVEHIYDQNRNFIIRSEEIAKFNPNTQTMPLFRTRRDYELAMKIYSLVPVLVNEKEGINLWRIRFINVFHSGSDSKFFMDVQKDDHYPMYEAKMTAAYDHRFANVLVNKDNKFRPGQPEETTLSDHLDFSFQPKCKWFVPSSEITKAFEYLPRWYIAYKRIVGVANERTLSAMILPTSGASDSLVALDSKETVQTKACLLANLNSLVLDYIARLKISAITINYFVAKQLPVLPPSVYTPADIDFLVLRVLELVYTAYDLKPFAEDMGYYGEPFRWEEERRALLRAELDAYYAKLYSLTRDELRYILDPQDVYGPDFPGETFRVLKDKEIRQFGEYRTRRLVLEAWDRLEEVEPAPAIVTAPVESPTPIVEKHVPAIFPQREETESAPEPITQPMLSDFGLYKCQVCGEMVMGYEKDVHVHMNHGGKKVLFQKIRG